MKNLKSELHCLRWVLRYIGIWFLVWYGMALAMNESVVDRFVENADTPVLLLEGYCKQQLWLFTTAVLAIVITIVFGIVAIIFQIKEEHKPENIKIVKNWAAYGCHPSILIIIFAGFVLIPIVMLKDEPLIEQYKQIQKDIAAIEEDRLRSDLVILNSDFSSVDFVLYGEDYADTAVCYYVVGFKESREHLPAWEKIYVPNLLNFNMDTEHAYNEWKDISWNEYHSTVYRITYTPNLHFVVSIEVESQGR